MLRQFSIIAVLGFLMISCGQVKEQEVSATSDFKLISELVGNPLEFDGEEVSFEGVITHICKHSGDKMRVNQLDDAGFSIMVMLDDFQTQFSPEFEGKRVKVVGILKTTVLNAEEAHNHNHEGHGEEGHECASSEEAAKALKEKGITPDIRAYIELKGWEVIEVADDSTECKEKEESAELAEATKVTKSCCNK
jgi:hypothetical protein